MSSSNRRSACVGMAVGMLLADRALPASGAKAAAPAVATSPASLALFDAACRAGALVRGASELDDWLAKAVGRSDDPLAPLSPGGRRRLLASLVFREGVLVGIDTADLEAELSLSQAYRVLSLFGMQARIVGLPDARVDTDEDRAVAAWRARLEADA